MCLLTAGQQRTTEAKVRLVSQFDGLECSPSGGCRFRYSERVQEEWFEVDRNGISHSGACVHLVPDQVSGFQKKKSYETSLFMLQHNLKKLRCAST